MSSQEILDIIADVVQREKSSVESSTLLVDLNWDSLCNVLFMSRIDEVFGLEVDSEKLSSAETVRDLVELVPR